ncbi:MAG: methylenetetrahydrofolate reductase [Clostridiales bacterium]|nr:methylenetetrahydrofolate reductase [Clostridiales bacterium]
MKLTELLQSNRPTVSCELFPPKPGTALLDAPSVVRRMAALHPAYMSVTCSAGGSGNGGVTTADMANEVQNINGITALAHLTCVAATRDEVRASLEDLKKLGIENILALRGDLPRDGAFPHPDGYHHASELMEEIRTFGGFCIGGACYPEGHPESATLYEDIDNLKYKVDAGCEFLTTQMFFDNNELYSYLYKLRRSGIDIPVIAGIMPVTNASQIKRIMSLSGSQLPARFRAIIDRFAGNPAAVKQAGIAYATEQIIDLLANGVDHVHIYTMNKPEIAGSIMANLSEILQ